MWKYFIAALIIFGTFTFGYMLYKDNQNTIKNLTQDNIVYKNAAEQNKQAYDNVLDDVEQLLSEQNSINQDQQKIDQIKDTLLQKLRKHDMGNLAKEKPQLIENRINRAAQDINRCMEILSGSPLTMEEIDATKPSEINGSCSNIANPNYND